MKKYIISGFICLLAFGCEKPYDKDKEIGPPIYSAENFNSILNGKWVLSKASQVDELSLTKESIDITDFYSMSPATQKPNITFNTTNQTFVSDTTGVMVSYFGSSGTWSYDDNNYPTKIILNSGTVIPIGSNIQAPGGYLEYQESASCSGSSVMTFKLQFAKQ